MIFTINSRDNVLLSVGKNLLNLSDNEVHNQIQQEYLLMVERLRAKHIDYASLKKALVPSQSKKHHELCLAIDSLAISDPCYGHVVLREILKALDKSSTYSILAGDYVNRLHNYGNGPRQLLHNALYEVLTIIHPSQYIDSEQYFLVYFNSVTETQADAIISRLSMHKWFHGYAFIDYDSLFKSYLADSLCVLCVKAKNKIICAQPADYSSVNSIGLCGYPVEQAGFIPIGIDDISFSLFLSYKIETIFEDETDQGFSINAILPKFDSIGKLRLNISEEKFRYLCSDKTGKDGIMKSIGYNQNDLAEFCKTVYLKICKKYIFNLERNKYGVYKFNVCIDIPTVEGKYRKTTIALKYSIETGMVDLLTIT